MTLLSAYNFDEASGNVLDVTGNGRDFALSGNTIRAATGHTSKGLSQTSSEVFTVSAGHLSGMQTANRTMMAWVKEALAITGWVLEFHSSSIGSGSWGILFLSNQWNIQARNSGGFVRASVARPTDGAFHHFAGTYDGTNVRAYLDGTLVATQALTAPMRTDADVFRFLDNSSSSTVIDDVRFYDAALDQATIASLMGTPVVGGRTGKPKIWSGSAWTPRQGKYWNGSAWVNMSMWGHDGSDFIESK